MTAAVPKHEWLVKRFPFGGESKVCKHCGAAHRPGQNDFGLCGGLRGNPPKRRVWA